VSKIFLGDVSMPSDEIRAALGECCKSIHMTMDDACDRFFGELRRRVYTTPKSYLDMISLYLTMLSQTRETVNTKRSRLQIGLQKLKDTTNVVEDLRATLEELKPVLDVKTKETNELLEVVSRDQIAADKIKAVVEVEAATVSKQAEDVAAVQADAQKDLDKALPALKKAMKSLDNLKKGEVAEVKGMQKPPPGVVKTMEAVCILLGEKPDWETAKKVMTNTAFLKNLKDYDKDNIPDKMVQKLKKYIDDPALSDEAMAKVSQAGGMLMTWVGAMVMYSEVAKTVEPKKLKVAELNAVLAAANAALKEKLDSLHEVEEKVRVLKETLDAAQKESRELAAKSNQTAGRLERADKLMSGFGSQQVSWAAEEKKLGEDYELLVGDCFLSAACVSYAGPFTGEYRANLISNWLEMVLKVGIPTSQNYTLQNTLAQPVEVRQWNINGLPTDDVSIDSAVMVKYGSRWPLMIDPQEQAKKWIKNENKGTIVVTRMTSPDLLKVMEAAVRNGKPVLIEDIGEEIEGSLDPILGKQTFTVGGRTQMRLGDSDVDYDDNFMLYITTKLPNPHYLPEICIKVNLLNFTVTLSGLEDQLLGDVVKKERSDVEEKKNRLVVSMAADRKQLHDLEAKILHLLSTSTGNILDDQVLIDTLSESKSTSLVIEERVKESMETQAAIQDIREKYRPVAIRGSILYFVVSDLALIDPMYQYSLAYYMALFNKCIVNAEPSDDLEVRLETLIKYITENMYLNVCRGLFEAHKLIYALLICTQIMRKEQQTIGLTEWNLLIRTAARLKEDDLYAENPNPKVIPALSWEFVVILQRAMPEFEGLCDDMAEHIDEWAAYIQAVEPQKEELPSKWGTELTPFQKLLVLKAFRPEKLVFAFSDFVGQNLGEMFTVAQNTPLSEVHKDTDNKTPVIFILSTGADPTGILLRFAKDMKYGERLNVISLGQGQGPNAQRLVREGKKSGDWVLLQNCHLAKSWMPELEMMVDAFEEDTDTHPDFRLWLTSSPAPYFPVSTLQKGVKLTNEPPMGLRANLSRTYATVVNAEEFDKHSKPHPWKKLLFGLCFFHATIQERKKFGPLGWNIMYEFNDSDLEISVQVLRMFLEEQDEIPWDALRYVCGQINFGGRVTDDWDRRALMSILGRFFTPGILTEAYKFSPSGTYYAPAEGPIGSYVEYLSTLPNNEDPEIFGMHENANITFQRKETNKVLETVLGIQPREVGGGGGLTPDEIISNLATEMLEGLPELLKFKKQKDQETEGDTVESDHEEDDNANVQVNSLDIVLKQEIERFNRLLTKISRTLSEIQRAIKGEVVMSIELDLMYTAMINNQVPLLWEKVAYPSLKPLASWMIDLQQRMVFFHQWTKEGPPASFWLSGFFFPQGFMTGVLQNHARKYKLPIDKLAFQFDVQSMYERKEVSEAAEDGVYIDGLFMDGARWDPENKVIADSNLGELFSNVPIIHFIPTDREKSDVPTYECPVYKTSVRAGLLSTTGQSTNFVLAVELPTNHDTEYWVLKGAAILCQLDS
jgi:dynein heavy chain